MKLLFFALALLLVFISNVQPHEKMIRQMASGGSIPPEVFVAMAKVESATGKYLLGDGGKARGIFQIHRAAVIDSDYCLESIDELFEPKTNTLIAIHYLYKQYNKHKNLWCAVSAYNMGINKLTAYSYKNNCRHHEYVQKVKQYLN